MNGAAVNDSGDGTEAPERDRKSSAEPEPEATPDPETMTGATDQDSESSAPVATESGKMTVFGISGGISGAFP